MNAVDVPIGKSESQILEFKSAREIDSIAKSKSDLGRSVVAMLNAKGGQIWIGVAEKNSIAVELENITSVEKAHDAVLSHLLDTIQPPPSNEDVQIQPVTASDTHVLALTIRAGSQRPYAFVRQGRRYYIRSDRRVRDMTHEELRVSFNFVIPTDSNLDHEHLARLRLALDERRTQLQEAAHSVYWVGLQAGFVGSSGSELEFDLTRVEELHLLTDPAATGNRRSGTLATSMLQPVHGQKRIRIADERWGELFAGRDGRVDQVFPMNRLWDYQIDDSNTMHRVHPIIWIENAAFPCRLMRALLLDCSRVRTGSELRTLDSRDWANLRVVAQAAMIHADGIRMRPRLWLYGPLASDESERSLPTEHGHWQTDMIHMSGEDMKGNPDDCAYRMSKEFFRSFEFDRLDTGPDPVPGCFDKITGRLTLPE